jgi:Ca-activated chloride channel family protein
MTFNLPPGDYQLRFEEDLVVHETTLKVPADQPVDVRLVLDAVVLKVGLASRPGGPALKKSRITVSHQGKKAASWGPGTFLVPAGQYEVSARHGKVLANEKFSGKPGEIVEKSLISAVGKLKLSTQYGPGGEMISRGVFHRVFPANSGERTQAKAVASGWDNREFILPPGEYVVASKGNKAQASTPVVVEGDQRADLIVDLNAGELAVLAKGAKQIEIRDANPDSSGRHPLVDTKWGASYRGLLQAGQYRVVARFKDRDNLMNERVLLEIGRRLTVSLP